MRNDAIPDTQVVCQLHDPDIWLNEETEGEAVKLCLTGNDGLPCPALAACLDIGTDPAEPYTHQGVWGGLNNHKRDRIRARRNRKEDIRYPIVTFTAPNCQTPVEDFYS